MVHIGKPKHPTIVLILVVSTLLRKALCMPNFNEMTFKSTDDLWKLLMLEPEEYSQRAINNTHTRALMNKMTFEHGGADYDKRYPEGIPTSVQITTRDGRFLDSGLIMFPAGHSKNTSADLAGILSHKFNLLGRLALKKKSLNK